MNESSFPDKDPSEVIIAGFDMTDILDGETVSTCTFSVSVIAGTDATPSNMLSGAADISDDPIVKQKLIGGVAGVTYKIKATITTSGTRTLIDCARLRVRNC